MAMPYPNEHAARQAAPGQFGSFRRSSEGFPAGISVIYGITDGKSKIQSVRFNASKWTPAQAKKWLKDNNLKTGLEEATGKAVTLNVTKVDAEQRLVFGWLYVSVDKDGQRVVDHSREFASIGEIESAAYGYAAKSRAAGVMHQRMEDGSVRKVGHLVCSIVFTPEMTKALNIPDNTLPQGWWVGYKIEDDDTWSRVKSGELRCFSIGGRAQRKEVE